MWFHAIFDSLLDSEKHHSPRRAKRPANRRRNSRRLLLEGLEDRRLLAFDLAVDYPTGSSPQAVITADFNNDGRLDVATANHGSGTVSVLLGSADGRFQPARNSDTLGGARSMAVGDFNADGKLDLVSAVPYGGLVVSLGNGDGTFIAPTDVIGVSAASVAVGDFNRDGKLDLAATSNYFFPGYYYAGDSYTSHVNVLLGNGAGSFAAPIESFLGYGYHTSAAVADFNGDGKLDFASASRDSGAVDVVLGAGTGVFEHPIPFSAGFWAFPNSVIAGDVNADGKVDLVTANTAQNSVSVLLGDGRGSFAAAQSYAAGSSPHSVALADFNGDGRTDLATANTNVGATISVMLATDAGQFTPPLTVEAYPYALAIGDFNADGLPDAVYAVPNSNQVSVLLNDGIWPALDLPSMTINGVAVMEGNTGTVDAAFTVNLSAAFDQTVSVHYATADGSATAGSDYQAASGTLTFAPGVTSQTIIVLVIGDRIGEGTDWTNEWFSVNLSAPTNAYIARATGQGIIVDDEPSLSIDYVSGMEGNTGATPFRFTVTLSAPYDAPVTVDYTTADLTPDLEYYYGPSAIAGLDYTATAGTLTIPTGQLSGTIEAPVIGDRDAESSESETFSLLLSNPSGARLNNRQTFGTIFDDEPYVSISGGGTVVEGDSGTQDVTFTVTLFDRYDLAPAAYDADVTVSYATIDGSAKAGNDYQAASGVVTIPAGQLSQTFTVQVYGDLLAESYEHFNVYLTGSTNSLIYESWAAVDIIDNDIPLVIPTIAIGDASVVEGASGTNLMTFAVSLSHASGQGVWVSYTTANGSATTSDKDYLARSGTIYFAPGETIKTITISIQGDTKKEKDEQFYVNLSSASGAAIADSQGVGTIVNDDGAGKGNAKSAQISSDLAVDAAMEDWMFSKAKKRGR